MDGSDVKFNSKLKMSVKVDQQPESVLLELSDSLAAAEQELELPYKQRIADFVNASGTWYRLAVEKIRKEDSQPGKMRLTQIFVLSEPSAEFMVFGLQFRVEIDIEHGRGMKLNGDTLQILEYGSADVAFA